MEPIVLPSCTLRPLRVGDAPSIARYADNVRVWRNLLDTFPHPYTLADAEAWVARCAAAEAVHALGIIVDDEVVGMVGIEPGAGVFRRSMEIGYWLGEPYWRRGIATQAAGAMTDYAFGTFDINRLWAGVFGWNPASARVLEKCGYVLEGVSRGAVTKDGATTDELRYARLRGG